MFESVEAARGQPVEYFNRHTGKVEIEQVYGEGFLRWAYESGEGRFTAWAVARRGWFAHWYGWRMRRSVSRIRIRPFLQQYGLDESEFAESVDNFRSFNDFFIRRLKAGVRPLADGRETIVFGADGRHLGFPDVSAIDGVFIKGQRWNLAALLGDSELARRYAKGTLVLSRLCPVDYHRFHFPADGTPGPARPVRGTLWSVNPIALRRRLAYLWENRRMITEFETKHAGRVLLIEVGATNVGTIHQTYAPGRLVARGDEKGYFSFGGSATVTLFEPRRVRLADDLVEQSRLGRELYARMGSALAVACSG
jgi:phosphatidylserine decarboxylase